MQNKIHSLKNTLPRRIACTAFEQRLYKCDKCSRTNYKLTYDNFSSKLTLSDIVGKFTNAPHNARAPYHTLARPLLKNKQPPRVGVVLMQAAHNITDHLVHQHLHRYCRKSGASGSFPSSFLLPDSRQPKQPKRTQTTSISPNESQRGTLVCRIEIGRGVAGRYLSCLRSL